MQPSFIVFSGGSACNFISKMTLLFIGNITKTKKKASTFQSITPSVCYVLGVSDNGGSTVK